MNNEKIKAGLEALAGEDGFCGLEALAGEDGFCGLEALAGEEEPPLPAKASMPLS